jgi:hypothetical protein
MHPRHGLEAILLALGISFSFGFCNWIVGFVRRTWQAGRGMILSWMSRKSRALPPSPFRRFNSAPEVIRLVVMMYVRFPLSLRNVEDLLFERGIDVCHEMVRMWWNRFGAMFAGDIRRQQVSRMRGFCHWRWHLDEMYVKLNGEMVYLWRAVDHEGEILESYITKTRERERRLLHEEGAEASRQARDDHHRRTALVRCGDEGIGQYR